MITLASRLLQLPTLDSRRNLRRNLRATLGDGAAASLMVGLGETYIPALVLALGLGNVAAALVATVPLLIGSILQLAAPWAARQVGNYRRWVVGCATCQALSLFAMSAIALHRSWSGWWVFAAASVYWGSGLASSPTWNTWVEDLVPRTLRATFFASRVRVCQSCTLVGLVTGGLLLRVGVKGAGLREMFAVMMAAAGMARLISAYLLSRQSDMNPIGHDAESEGRESPISWNGSGTRLVAYLMSVQVAVYLAGPYFTPFMLTKLKLSYLQYMTLLSSAFLGKIIALPWVGAIAKRAGARRLLLFGGLGIVPVAALWLISGSFAYLIGMQFVAGMLWSGYELAVALIFFETIPRNDRITVMTWYNVGNSTAMAGGALCGAFAMTLMGDSMRAYLTLFALSSLARCVTLALLPRERSNTAVMGSVRRAA